MEHLTSSSFKRSQVEKTITFERVPSAKTTHRSSSDGSSSAFNRLQAKIGEFEDLGFPSLQLPTSRNREKKKKKVKKVIQQVKEYQPSKVFVKFSVKNTRKDVISETADYLVHSEAIGPGKYETRGRASVAGGLMSNLPRFNQGLMQVIQDFLQTKKRRLSESFVQKNLDLSAFHPANRIQNIQDTKKNREFEEIVHIKTKNCLTQLKKEERLRKYNEKMEKFEWRLKGEEIKHVKKTWNVLSSAVGFAFGIKLMILSKIARNKRIKKNFILLGWLCRFIGKIALRLRNFRWKVLIQAVDRRSRYIRLWLNNRGNLYKKMILSVIDKAMLEDYMFQFMGKFKKTVIFIQGGIREMLKVKRARNWALVNLFNKLERQVSQSREGKRLAKGTTQQINIDEETRKFYTQVAREHISKVKSFNEEMKIYQETLEKALDDKTPLASFESSYPLKRPVFFLYSRQKEILKVLRASLGIDTNPRSSPMKKPLNRSPALRRQSILSK
jgi:hypothetical protein